MIIKRGDIVLVSLDPVLGSEQGKTRPCLIVQNDIGNQYSSNTIVVPLTSVLPDKNYPTVVVIQRGEAGLPKDSAILCTQIRTISKDHRIVSKLGSLKQAQMKQVNHALKVSLALD
ncbi:MAG: type II toxin-antitoxin system PemK/MazF family toxin [Candidatus Diapherotrites archaeon]|nr:type II toxin-antitoxin system PemK/MazF family toxin [Candidatus Diapherotrites archaeon]